jgi:glycosyltransferase involved in cell wall biosynthesis
MAVQSYAYDIVMLVLNDVAHDARVRREAAALAGAGWHVLVVGTQRAGRTLPQREALNGFDILRVNYGRLGARKWWPWRWIRHGLQAGQIVCVLRKIPARAYHAHDLPALILVSLVRGLKRNRPALVYDSHELFLFMSPYRSRLFQRWHRLTRPVFMGLEGYLMRRADAVITLGESKARFLARWYGIPRPVLVRNVIDPVREEERAPLDLREITGGRPFIIHTGIITRHRRCLAELVEALSYLPKEVTLVFLGEAESAAQTDTRELLAWAERLHVRDRVFVVPPVPPELVPVTIQSAQAAAVLLRSEPWQADHWNVRTSLPTKLFEAVAAGLPVVASRQYTLARLVRSFELGECCATDPESIAAAFDRVLDPERQTYYRARIVAARQILNWQTESARLDVVYRGVLGEHT